MAASEPKAALTTEREAKLIEWRKIRALNTPQEKTKEVDLTLGDIQCTNTIGSVSTIVKNCCLVEGHLGPHITYAGQAWPLVC